MRILFLAHRLPYPPDKGDKIRSFFELESLGARHEVDLFCFYDCAEDAQYLEKVRSYCHSLYAERLSWTRSRLSAAKALASRTSFSLGYFYSARMAQRVREALSSNGYDLVFVFSSSMAQYVEQAVTVPRILDMVDVDSDKWLQYVRKSSPPRSWLWKREAQRLAAYEEKIASEFSLTLLCTEPEADLLRHRVPSPKIQVLSNRVDETYWDPKAVTVTPEITAWQPYVIFTGSMDYLPNEDAALYFYRECFPHLRSAAPEVKFVIAGRNPTTAIRKLREDPAVCVTGSVPDIRPWLLGACAAVAPLRIARGIQNKVLEAMAMGVPVITNSKTAAALPESLVRVVDIEDQAVGFARRVGELARRRDSLPLQHVRDAVLDALGTVAARKELELLTGRVVLEKRTIVPA
jgi:sugar transferase (PEP-CTERM/EpsH1 system associated)